MGGDVPEDFAPEPGDPLGLGAVESDLELLDRHRATVVERLGRREPIFGGFGATVVVMTEVDTAPTVELSMSELREVTGYAVACAEPALAIFERDYPDDRRPREALDAARAFARGAKRTKAIRNAAWAAQRAFQQARDAGRAAAGEAARAALAAAGAAFLHPLAKATQVPHILGSAAHAARAFELDAGDDPRVAAGHLATARELAGPVVVSVLRRYPAAPGGRGRVGELVRELDAALRSRGLSG